MLETTRWKPKADLTRYSEPMSWFFDRFFEGEDDRSSLTRNQRRWAPPTDIRETESGYEVTAELPGMTKDDVNVTLEDNVLTLTGARHFERDTQEDDFHRIERSYGTFMRSFSLPSKVDADEIGASFKDGVLKLSIPKMEDAKPRKISIQ